MRQLTASIYISFGFLFSLMRGMDGYMGPDNIDWIIFFFIVTGVFYFSLDFRDFMKKKLQ